MSYSINPTDEELLAEIKSCNTMESLVEWTGKNTEVIAFLSAMKCDRGALDLFSSMGNDELDGGPSSATLLKLAEFRRALLN